MYKYQANQKCDHGFVGGPYPKDSKLYGSPYYLNCIKNGCTISEQDEQRAKEAMIKAGSEMPKKTVATSDVATPAAAPVPVPTKPEKKAKKVMKVKVKSSIPVLETPVADAIPSTVTPVKPTMVESTEAPIVVEDIIRVKVKKIRHQGKDYYFDGNSGKLYNATKEGVGKYAGRYNEEADVINTSYPDSDEE
jgi:ribosomal protein L14